MEQQGNTDFDLSRFELVDTAIFTVLDSRLKDDLIGADGVNPVQVELYSPGTEFAVKAEHKVGQQSALRMQALLRGKVDKNEAATAEAEQVARLTAYTKRFINFPLSPKQVYSNPKLGYIAKQVQGWISEAGNFSPASSPTSSSTSDN